jgi:hypothetical protein
LEREGEISCNETQIFVVVSLQRLQRKVHRKFTVHAPSLPPSPGLWRAGKPWRTGSPLIIVVVEVIGRYPESFRDYSVDLQLIKALH